MIQRRLGERLKQHDWVAVTIELILVVVGVFLGIQVANWNEQRKEQSLESAYQSRIAQDVRSDIDELNEIIRVSAVRMAILNRILSKASGQPLPEGFDSARGRVAIEPVPTYDPGRGSEPTFALFILTPLDGNRSAYQTMISTGAIADMHDITTLRRIQDYYAAVDREMHFEVALEQNRDKLIDAQRDVGISPVRPMTVDQLSSAFAANPKLLATAENYWLYTNRHLKLTRELQVQAQQLGVYLQNPH
jgi:hypothetical protein